MSTDKQNNPKTMRLDKWLWCARFYKTRRQATDAIKSGKVKSNADKVKPSHLVKPGDIYTIRQGPYSYEITVKGLATHRRPASEAALLHEESQDSQIQREKLAKEIKANNAMISHSQGRPTKRERRKLIRFTQKNSAKQKD
ncbi:MAG: RNA-binding protein [Gammaproteobacteria bacterium]|nr:RNA-binding protein [Gammaproteobacteria bacterium]